MTEGLPPSVLRALIQLRTVLNTELTMSRRLAILLLVAVVAAAGVVSCPRGAKACAFARKSAHDCCKQSTALRTGSCCCADGQQMPSPAIGASYQYDHSPAKALVAVLPLINQTGMANVLCAGSHHLRHGLAPPGTPVTQHTLLLL